MPLNLKTEFVRISWSLDDVVTNKLMLLFINNFFPIVDRFHF